MSVSLAAEKYIGFITDCLSWLMHKVELADSVCLFNVNHISEDVYKDILNALFGWKLININNVRNNAKAIDLIDSENRILVQVSSRRDKAKVQEALNGLSNRGFNGYRFYYVCITNDPPVRPSEVFVIPTGIVFQSPDNVFGVQKIVKRCKETDISRLERVFDICHRHFALLDKTDNRIGCVRVVSMDDARLFIYAFASVYGELDTSIDICEAFLAGQTIECGIPRIDTHLHTHLNRKTLLTIDIADEFRRRVMDIPELWQEITDAQALQWKIDCTNVDNAEDVKIARDLLVDARCHILNAARIVARLCPSFAVFEAEFNNMIMN